MSGKNGDVAELVRQVEQVAREQHGGHLTIMSFTTHWKAAYGTPDLDSGKGRWEVESLPAYPTLEAALAGLLTDGASDFYLLDVQPGAVFA